MADITNGFFHCRRPTATDGEPRYALQGGAPAAADATEEDAQEGSERCQGAVPVAAEPQVQPD